MVERELFFEIENDLYKLSTGDSVVAPTCKEHKVRIEMAIVKAVDAGYPVNNLNS